MGKKQREALLKGRAHKFGDNISTDLIAPGRLFHLRNNLPELAKHTLEDADPDFVKNVKKGGFVVGGRNFGLGSSREHAPVIIKLTGVSAVLAKSFARIFFRNAINSGLPALECDTDGIDNGDELEILLSEGVVKNRTKGTELAFHRLPPIMIEILDSGGLVEHIKKNKDLKI